jgi:hypothetical protein
MDYRFSLKHGRRTLRTELRVRAWTFYVLSTRARTVLQIARKSYLAINNYLYLIVSNTRWQLLKHEMNEEGNNNSFIILEVVIRA